MKKGIKKVVGAVAPMIGAAIGGPFAPIAGAILGKVLGGDDKKDVLEKVEDVILAGNPEEVAKIRQAELEFAQWMREMDVKESELSVENMKSAREMYEKTQDKVTQYLAVVIMTGFFAVICWVLWMASTGYPIPESTIFGMVIAGVLNIGYAVINFYYGSSLGSKSKTKLLNGKS